ncbi:Autophagy-related protein 17 [Taphrina deformans PYCC 5710]|uniref:Autophagy-related protein 17 n=1 Tax=Taphrina deformans (strain PYCC 5710 / ATCC 11124 / CBS 356.35 / IMI 108563 / JCM 9778 / NBRC 8474) TaxID=1097556 RepID=R4XDD5_TAPDE|nr:Autophagy-related protein 17 [Taphrina deformans PYCC 5710]|eukprot:CCG81354.1 Autophagy-related protein 17 [Taphrina deformans PYCC 5710]
MTSRTAVYEHYSAAKQALSRGNTICEHAHELSKETESSLASAAAIAAQIRFLRDALQDQLQILQTIASQIVKEEEKYQVSFTSALTDLDVLDGSLNNVLERLKTTPVAKELRTQLPGDVTGSSQNARSTDTLFDFADDTAIESLKGQLRQVVDDMQENQENLDQFRSGYVSTLAELDKACSTLPDLPDLPLSSTSPATVSQKSAPTKRSPLSMSVVTKGYTKQQEDHINEMAGLLLSLSKHYDHASTLLKSESTLPMDELEELHSIVEHDAQQLEDVILELDERVVDLEADVALVKAHINICVSVQGITVELFSRFEALDVDSVTTNLVRLRKDRGQTDERLDELREQLVALASHYAAFSQSYDALLIEVDRRVKYENTVSNFLAQTRQTLARIAQEESARREDFIHDHGDTLPGDIWPGIRHQPVTYDFDFGDAMQQTPKLPESLISSARNRLSNSGDL